jgi:hypothetical protein
MRLDQKGTAMAEYIWIDSTGGVRSKSKVRTHHISFFSIHIPDSGILAVLAKLAWLAGVIDDCFFLIEPLDGAPFGGLPLVWATDTTRYGYCTTIPLRFSRPTRKWPRTTTILAHAPIVRRNRAAMMQGMPRSRAERQSIDFTNIEITDDD